MFMCYCQCVAIRKDFDGVEKVFGKVSPACQASTMSANTFPKHFLGVVIEIRIVMATIKSGSCN